MNNIKIFNDPVYGFVSIPSGLIFDLINHSYFQRLRYIKQVSMTHLVYPGALHTRFQHAIGAMHLMQIALKTLASKGIPISEEEEEAALAAILLHDIGHGPFSHSLEHTIIEGVSHELLSSLLMDRINADFSGKLDLAIAIFTNQYERPFFHQLVSGQLDTDRMDYLNRDSFYTGVSEGVISHDRIIAMLNVVNNRLVVEEKGIYSVEKFLTARRLMYWQVYLHKTVVGAEQILIKILERAKYLVGQGQQLFATPALAHFLEFRVDCGNFTSDPTHLDWFTRLDDMDIMSGIKAWVYHADSLLSMLCERLLKRDLYHSEIGYAEVSEATFKEIGARVIAHYQVTDAELPYYVFPLKIQNSAYSRSKDPIMVLMKNGEVQDLIGALNVPDLGVLEQKVTKYGISYPKEIGVSRS